MPEDKEINDILAKCGDPIECSNGTAYIVDEYPFTAVEQFFKRIKVSAKDENINKLSAGTTWLYTKGVNESFSPKSGFYTATKQVEPEGTEELRQTYSYVDFKPTSTTVRIGFNVAQTLSGTYDIYLVTCPIWLMDYTNKPEDEWDLRPYRFKVNVFERDNGEDVDDKNTEVGQFPTKATFTFNNPNPIDEQPANIYLSQAKPMSEDGFLLVNDTTYIGQYSFHNAYYGRSDYGVIIQIEPSVLNKDKTKYSNEMLISSLILKPHDEDLQEEVVEEEQGMEAKKRIGNQLTTLNIRK
jgi:hypothetical protein